MRIALYTMHAPSIAEMAAITLPNKAEYCMRNGYTLYYEPFRHTMFPGFERLPVLMTLVEKGGFDWVFWLGTDALITNMNAKLESLADDNFGVVMATDAFQIQMDSFLVKGQHKGALELLWKVWERRDNPIAQHYEQSTYDALMREPEHSGVTKLVPQRAMNSYKYALYREFGGRYATGMDLLDTSGEWHRGDFVLHVPGRPLSTKVDVLRQHVPMIVR